MRFVTLGVQFVSRVLLLKLMQWSLYLALWLDFINNPTHCTNQPTNRLRRQHEPFELRLL